jgi:hypothetical protein
MALRERTHWNIANIQPIDPVALGLCKQLELDAAVQKAAKKNEKEGGVMSEEERMKLLSTEQSLHMPEEPKVPGALSAFENFTLSDEPKKEEPIIDADSLFNLPKDGSEKE